MKRNVSIDGPSSLSNWRARVSPGTKRAALAVGLCSAMLGLAVFVFMPIGSAQAIFPGEFKKENVIEALLDLPAPPPPNPLDIPTVRDESFYDPKKPPPDDAPIEDLLDYWSRQAESNRGALFYLIKPSEKVTDRLLDSIERDLSRFAGLSKIFPDDKRTSDTIKGIYDRLAENGGGKESREGLRQWLKFNSGYFAEDLERVSSLTRDSRGYVDLENENSVLSLTKHDWERAKPIVERMYNDASNPVTKVLATWALYKHALLAGDSGDIDRYRSELMRIVEDKNQTDGVRDKANDAISHEADFPGRDDWTFSLFEDETLVKMDRFTMLTTLIMYDSPDRHVQKLTGLLESKNPLVRLGAVRCLTIAYQREKNPAIVKAMLPWIENPKWIDIEPDSPFRTSIVQELGSLKMPEAVPGLIAALDEKATRTVADESGYSNSNIVSTNTTANVARRVWTSNSSANANSSVKTRIETYYPLRDAAIRALAFQADSRAVPSLRRLLAVTKEEYKIEELMRAIFACGGYSVAEQVEALEYYAGASMELAANLDQMQAQIPTNANAATLYAWRQYVQSQAPQFVDRRDGKFMLGAMVASNAEPSQALVAAVIGRITELEKKEPRLAHALRQIIVSWKGTAISALMLRDLKTGKADSNVIVRLLTERRWLRETLAPDIAEARGGTPIAAAVTSCLLENGSAYQSILESKDLDARTALYACARLIRAELPVEKVSADLKSENALLKSAAELYLESEDSPAARSAILALHPGEAKILGATRHFKGRSGDAQYSAYLAPLFASVNIAVGAMQVYGPEYDPAGLSAAETKLQKEIKEDTSLEGIYSYRDNFVRIHKDRVAFSWEDDPSRYHERNLSKEEFDTFKNYLAAHNVVEMKPFISCNGGCGVARELLMLGLNGGSRIYVQNERTPQFFLGLEKLFEEFRAEPAAIKYSLSKEVPGLELLFANDALSAETVWKQGSDLRMVVGDAKVRERIDEEIGRLEEIEQAEATDEEDEDDSPGRMEPSPEAVMPSQRMRTKRQYDEFEWRRLENGQLGAVVTQPTGVEYIPLKDNLDAQPDQEQWKARAAGVEIRVGFDGLYKITAGRLTKLLPGNFTYPIISPNGRWVVVHRFDESEGDTSVIRYNLMTRKYYKIESEGYAPLVPSCFIPAIGKFLMVTRYYGEEGLIGDTDDEEQVDEAEEGVARQRYYFLNADTGTLTPATANVRPLVQQTFRPLQPTGRANEFWAALSYSEKHETVVGTYDARLLRFTPVRKLPKINFNSMTMWVDSAEGRVYFVYNGHVLRIPLK